MHILFLTDNFPPESNAPATRTYEHAKVWVEQGHAVTVITCAPNFPEGKVYDGYKNKWFSREEMDGIQVWRVKTFIAPNDGFGIRILDFLSYMVAAFFAGLFIRKTDLVVATSPQFFAAVAGWATAGVKRVPFVFELRDIWPASVTAVGLDKPSYLLGLMERLELFLYRRAAKIIAVTHSFKEDLIERGIDGEKIEVVLNGIHLDAFQTGKDSGSACRKKFALQDKFTVGYIGTHGLAHALENILDCADLLRNEPDIQFVFVGSGAAKNDLEAAIAARGLANVHSFPRQAKEDMPAVWQICDVSLVSLRDAELFRQVIPSKIFESMASGLPMILSMPQGEAVDLVTGDKAGIWCCPENPQALADAVLKLQGGPELRQKMAGAGVKSVAKYDRSNLALGMLSSLEKVCE